MAIWQFTLNGNPARDGSGDLIPTFDDETDAMPGDAGFAEAERLAAVQLATHAANADGMTVTAYAKANDYILANGTHTYKS
jgi:hypothetical protein